MWECEIESITEKDPKWFDGATRGVIMREGFTEEASDDWHDGGYKRSKATSAKHDK